MKELLLKEKIPTTKDNYIGVEIEFLMVKSNREKFENDLVKAKLEYNVHVGYDGSVTDTEWIGQYNTQTLDVMNYHLKKRGYEIRILAIEKEIPEIVTKVCEIIKKHGGVVNKTCGLHVHLDMRNREFETVFNNFYFSQKLLFSTQPKERMTGRYSKMLRSSKSNVTTRYYGVNKLSYKKHRTLEIRMHEGSIDEKEILVWVGSLIKIADVKVKVKRQFKTFEALNVPQKVRDYFDERIKKFSGK